MRKKLATAVMAAAFAAAPVAAAPAQAAETHLCDIWADPFGRPCYLVMGIICRPPLPPLSICS